MEKLILLSCVAMTEKIKNIIVSMPGREVKDYFAELSNNVSILAGEIDVKTTRSNASIAYTNLANRTATELNRIIYFYPEFIEGIAWCARSLFEINLIIRHISRSEENMNRWLGQLAGDEKQIIQGFLKLSESSNTIERNALQNRLISIDEITAKHNIQSSEPFNIKFIAAQEQLKDEYTSLYKLFSKYVHPTSWLINSSTSSIKSNEYMNIFLIYSQIYAGDTYSRVGDWLNNYSTPKT